MHIFYLSDNGPAEFISGIDHLPETDLLWIQATPEEVDDVLAHIKTLNNVSIDDNHIQDVRNEEHPPYHEQGQGYEVLIFRHLLPTNESLVIKTQPVAFFILDRLVVTISHPEATIQGIYEQVTSAKKRNFRTTEGLVHFIVNRLIDQFLTVRFLIGERQTYWQHKLLDKDRTFQNWESLYAYRSHLNQLNFLCEVQQDAIEQWAQNMDEELFSRLAVRINDLKNHLSRVLHFTKKAEDEIHMLTQLHYAIVSHRTNEIIRILAIISSIFMPLSFLTGIFGMNFENMPILHWHHAFHATLFFMSGLSITLLIFFKVKKWI